VALGVVLAGALGALVELALDADSLEAPDALGRESVT
jgi:hypothetical protein